MNITGTLFSLDSPPRCIYMMPLNDFTRAGYSFAEFEAARSAIKGAFAQNNWDGYGALPIGQATKENALGVLNQIENLTAAPEVTLNPNGTLTFEWETNHGLSQLEIGRTRYSFFLKPYNGRALLDDGEASEVNPIVGRLVDALLFPGPSQPVTGVIR